MKNLFLTLSLFAVSNCKTPVETQVSSNEKKSEEFFSPEDPLLYILTDQDQENKAVGFLFYTQKDEINLELNAHISTRNVKKNADDRKNDINQDNIQKVSVNHLINNKNIDNLKAQRLREEDLDQNSLNRRVRNFETASDIPKAYKVLDHSSRSLALAAAVASFTIPLAIFVSGVPLVPVLIVVGSLFGGSVTLRQSNHKIYEFVEDGKLKRYLRIEAIERAYLMQRVGKEDYMKIWSLKDSPRATQILEIKKILRIKGHDTSKLNTQISLSR